AGGAIITIIIPQRSIPSGDLTLLSANLVGSGGGDGRHVASSGDVTPLHVIISPPTLPAGTVDPTGNPTLLSGNPLDGSQVRQVEPLGGGAIITIVVTG